MKNRLLGLLLAAAMMFSMLTGLASASDIEASGGSPAAAETAIVPEETAEPEETAQPEETQAPEETAQPEETQAPEETAQPEETQAPEETARPEETREPEETAQPEETREPEETAQPEETREPEDSAEPEEGGALEEETGELGAEEAYAGDSIDTATAIACGTTYSGSITSSNSKDVYKVTLSKSGRLSIRFNSGLEWVYFSLYDANGNQLWRCNPHWNGTTERNNFVKAFDVASGTYYVGVEKDGSCTGDYSLRLGFTAAGESFKEPQGGNNNSFNSAKTISLGTTYKGQLAVNDDRDFYKVTLNKSGRLTVKFDSSLEWVYCYLYDAAGTQLWSCNPHWNSTAERNTFSVPLDLTSGTYRIAVVRDGSDNTGTYTLRLGFKSCGESFKEPQGGNNNTMGAADSVSTGKTYKGQIALNDSKDFYKFRLTAKKYVTLNFSGDMGHIRILLYNSKGTELWDSTSYYDDASGRNRWSNAADLAAGTYYVAIEQYYGDSGNYNLAISAVTRNGWYIEDGSRVYYSNGVKKKGWIKAGTGRYYMNPENDGKLWTGWLTYNGYEYYLNPDNKGRMVTGFKTISSWWTDYVYYFDSNGHKRSSCWITYNSKRYYMDGDGHRVTGLQTIGGKKYYFDDYGVMQKGWQKADGSWYYFSSGGAAHHGWLQSGSYWYFLDDGKMCTGLWTIDGKKYYFSSSGIMCTGWQTVSGSKYYFGDNGAAYHGWMHTGSSWYFLYDGKMCTGWWTIDGKKYRFDSDGTMAIGWRYISSHWYYFQSNGVMYTGWLQQSDGWHYLKSNGQEATGYIYINGRLYHFSSSGVWDGVW